MPKRSTESARRGPGRPPAGLHGEAVSTLPKITINAPVHFRNRLNAIAKRLEWPQWRVLVAALDVFEESLRSKR
jgi:hypothetical protein